jgi:hypothetical protein
MDGRFSHHDKFAYCIKFSASMSHGHGPVQFNDALRWFTDTWGWSAEIRQSDKMIRWVATSNMISQQPWSNQLSSGILSVLPDHCNSHWSWTNGYDDLRIYVKSGAELAFFQLKFPVDQK